MAVPTAEQIMDILIDVGDPDAVTFNDADVARYWERCSGAQSDVQRHEAVMALMFRTLLSNAAKFRDYTAGETEEKMSQIFEQLKDLYEMYKPSLNAAQSQRRSVARAQWRNVPRQGRNYPAGFVHDPGATDADL